MQSKESIYKHLQEILADLFELEPDNIKPESRLYDDLDIDSIDAIDMVVKLKTFTNKKRLEPSEFKDVRTVQDVVDAVYLLLLNEDESTGDAE